MFCEEPDLRINFSLHSTFSSTQTRKPTKDELSNCDKIFINPDATTWNPYSKHYYTNENAMLDCNGELLILENKIGDPMRIQYLNMPTVDSVEVQINSVIQTSTKA